MRYEYTPLRIAAHTPTVNDLSARGERPRQAPSGSTSPQYRYIGTISPVTVRACAHSTTGTNHVIRRPRKTYPVSPNRISTTVESGILFLL